jgi:Leucine-rich repeat (LRR) protein
LEVLKIAAPCLKTVLKGISDLKQLRTLHIEAPVTDLFPLKSLPALAHLILSSEALRSIPEGIVQASGLETLELICPHLSTLPSTIGQLRSIRTLVLHCHNLKELPEEVGVLKELRRLEIVSFLMTNLPDTVASLSHLETVNISCTNLDTLPRLHLLPALRQLHVTCARPQVIMQALQGLCVEDLVLSNKSL